MNKKIKIVFMGTAEFAVPTLDILVEKGLNVAAVVTVPDKPAGRGRKIVFSPVKKYAVENNIPLLQPPNLKDESFLIRLKQINPDLQIVVAFRMLPKTVWELPKLGTINLHSSLLPQYRGAAPINWAVINGETETGVTTFFIDDNIDTGNIILSERISIDEHESAGELHDKLKKLGSELVLKTVELIIDSNFTIVKQENLIVGNDTLRVAPKIFKEDCRIDWSNKIDDIYNFIRGLSPYPAAHTYFISPSAKKFHVKIFKVRKEVPVVKIPAESSGMIRTDNRSFLKIACREGWINIEEIQVAGKRKMGIGDFLKGFRISNEWRVD